MTFKFILFDDYYLSPLTQNDAQARWKAFNNKEITKFLASPRKDPFTLQDAEEHVQSILDRSSKSPFPLSWAIRDANNPEMIGSIDLHTSDYGLDEYLPNPHLTAKYASFGFYLNPQYHSKGLVSKSLKLLVEKVAYEKFDIKYFFGGCFVGNIGSRKTFEKCGFKYVKTIKEGVVKHIPYEKKDIEVFELIMD